MIGKVHTDRTYLLGNSIIFYNRDDCDGYLGGDDASYADTWLIKRCIVIYVYLSRK